MPEPTPPPINANPPAPENPLSAAGQWSLALILGALLLCATWRGWSSQHGTHPTEVQPHRADLNHASRSELQQLPGIGPNRAETLLVYRESEGGFSHPDELKKVKGFGPKKQNQLRPWIDVPDESVPRDEAQTLTRKPSTNSTDAQRPARGQKSIPESKINVNQASITELQQLPGIGPAMSQRIVDERNRKSFEKIEDLRRVSGIGIKTLEKLRPYVSVGE